MTIEEFSNQFDVHYNNITSNQAPGLNEYEKSVFLTKAQNEIVKNYFTANSKGNNIGQGFDDSAKRQADFSTLMEFSALGSPVTANKFDSRDISVVFTLPTDLFISINEALIIEDPSEDYYQLQAVPLRYDEYLRLMSKPFKRPLKNQAWRLMLGNNHIEVIPPVLPSGHSIDNYHIRYIKEPLPIILSPLDGLSIGGYLGRSATDALVTVGSTTAVTKGIECELDPILHEDILQRAVELAKVAWTSTGQDNAQMVLQAGQRSE